MTHGAARATLSELARDRVPQAPQEPQGAWPDRDDAANDQVTRHPMAFLAGSVPLEDKVGPPDADAAVRQEPAVTQAYKRDIAGLDELAPCVEEIAWPNGGHHARCLRA